MASSSRRRLSFVDFSHPQVWHKLLQYSEVTIDLAKLITDFNIHWAEICRTASSQLHQLADDFRKKTEEEIRGRCHLGGRMYDLWESLLLESEIEAQSLQNVATVVENNICEPLKTCIARKTLQFNINKEYRHEFDEILQKGHDIVQELREEYSQVSTVQELPSDSDLAHNEYTIELAGVNGLYAKYQYKILPELLQDMEQSQLETIDTICQTIQLMASVLQEHHEQRHSSFASFVVTSTTTNPHEELENFICSMNDTRDTSTKFPVHVQFESFISPTANNSRSQCTSSTSTNEQLIIYAAPVIQMQLSSHCKEIIDRLKEIKKEKPILLAIINPQTSKIPVKQTNDQAESDKKILSQISDLMKRKHQLRLIELEESVLLAQQDLLKSHRPSMSSNADNEQDAQKRNTKNIKALWRDAFRALKTSTSASGSGDNENRSSFVRRFSSRKKKHHYDRDQEDQTVIDPVYETLKVAAETRKKTIAQYLQQRQQTLNKQTSLNSQGSSELDMQPSPRVTRHTDGSSTPRPKPSASDNARISNY